MPNLEPCNALAWEVFKVCSSQMLVVGMGTPLGLMFPAIDRAMEACRIHPVEREETFDKVRKLGEAYARHLNMRSNQKQQKGAKKQTIKPSFDLPPMMTKDEYRKVRDGETVELDEDEDL